MSIQLIPASYTQTDTPTNQAVRAISASITTSSGHDLFIAAISQKKIGEYAKGDTPRMALFSFLTGLQSGNESSIIDLVSKATIQAAHAVQGFVMGRNGAPCSLTVAILLGQRLFSLQIGIGTILHLEGEQFKTLNNPHSNLWLGSSFQPEISETISIQELEEPNVTVIVCQEQFATLIQDGETDFYKVFTSLAEQPSAETLPSSLAEWGRQHKLTQGLTIATLHAETKNFVDFFTLNEALLGKEKALTTSKQPIQALAKIEPTIDEIEENEKAPDTNAQADEDQSIHLGTPKIEEFIPQKSILPADLPVIAKESEPINRDYVVFSSAETIPTQAIDAEIAAPVRLKTADATTKVKRVEATKAAPRKPQVKVSKDKKESRIYTQLKSFVWPIIAALCTILLILLGFRFFNARWSNQTEANLGEMPTNEVVSAETIDLTPTGSISQQLDKNCVNPSIENQDACNPSIENLNPTASATATLKTTSTQTPTPSPTATSKNSPTSLPTETAEPTPVPPVGLLIRSIDEPILPIEVGETIIIDRLMRVAFAETISTTEPVGEVYAFPGSVLSFKSFNQNQSFEAEQGTTLFLDAQSELINAFLPAGSWILENQNGCMAIDYSRADRPLVASCYAGSCSWANGEGEKNDLPEGQRVELIPKSVDEDAEPNLSTIRGNESLAFYQQLSADPAGLAVANRCIAAFLPPPTAAPTFTPTPSPVPPTPEPSSNSGSNNPRPTSPPPPPTNTVAPTSFPTIESTPTKEQLPERPTVTPSVIDSTSVPDVTPEATAENEVFPATSTPTP